MEPEPEPLSGWADIGLEFFLSAESCLLVATPMEVGVSAFIILLLLGCSAMISGSEVAYFSLTSNDMDGLRKDNAQSPAAHRVLHLMKDPAYLLATILIANNFINIGIIILSEIAFEPFEALTKSIANPPLRKVANFSLTTVAVTFFLVLFGEVSPKVYAQFNRVELSKMMSSTLLRLRWLFYPLSSVLVNSSSSLEKRLAQRSKNTFSADEIDQAIELTVSQEQGSEKEADILRSLLQFNHIMAKQIMRPAVDVKFLNVEMGFKEVLDHVREWGYSRVPVFRENIDEIEGILHAKDLLPHLKEPDSFSWQGRVHKDAMFVPETKKITELLNEFKKSKVHMGIVVDEWGDTQGIVTMEDIMEEIIGDIKDEFDTLREVDYQKINANTYLFDGKTMLHDFSKILDVDLDMFDEIRGEADSLGGLLVEMFGIIPAKGKKFTFRKYQFEVVASTPKRVAKVKVVVES